MNKFFPIACGCLAALLTQVVTAAPNGAPLKPCSSVTVEEPTKIVLGKSTVVKLQAPAARLVVGGFASSRAGKPVEVDPSKKMTNSSQTNSEEFNGVADVDVMLLSPTELFFLGKRAGSMNVILQSADGNCTAKDLLVTIDPASLQAMLQDLLPEENGIKVKGAANSLVLTGDVSSSIALEQALDLARAHAADDKNVINMLRISSPQQVMLEVKVAEVSKNLLEKMGVNLLGGGNGGNTTYSLLSDFLSGGGGSSVLNLFKNSAGFASVTIDAQKDDGLIRVLAEPNIMAISGQQASFLSGGKIFIPVAQNNNNNTTTITLEEKEFGIGVKFTPTVLDGSRINLKLVSEVSELSQTGSPFMSMNGVQAVLPSASVRKADTTVQLNDGQSFVVAGLIKNNITETIKRFPGLGELPIIGALFRSTEFQNNQTELLFVITPRLVKPLSAPPKLPTDNHVMPSKYKMFMGGKLEGGRSNPSHGPKPHLENK